jgi:hypothetical protein
MSTVNLRPGILIIGAPLKYFENFSAYRVAEDIITFKSGRYKQASFINVKIISVCKDLS